MRIHRPAFSSLLGAYVFATIAALFGGPAVSAPQLNENCTVSVLNRNVQAKADGTWVLPNIPANFGRVRARATCVNNGVTTYGQSDFFVIPANGSITLPPIQLGNTTDIPTRVVLTSPSTFLTTVGQTMQLRAQATYSDGRTADVSAGSSGTSYIISNAQIATITPDGLVTAQRSGVVAIQAANEGSQGVTMLRVELGGGVDTDGDGIPDDVEIRLGMDPNNPADALLDEDHDGLNALEEYRAGTDPRNPDTDGDGRLDGDEVKCAGGFCSNPLLADTDGDGVRDGVEVQTGTDPNNPNSFNLARALSSISVTPGNFTLVVNSLRGTASVQLTVTGRMIDGFPIDLTSTTRQTTYASSDVQSCNFGSPDGRVFASRAGNCTITVSNNGFSAQVTGTVQDFSPSALSFVAIPGFANAVAVNQDNAFIAAGSSGLQVVGLSSDRRTPRIVASLNLSAQANDITLAGNIAYLATSTGLKVVDISTPTAPRLLGSFATGSSALAVRVRGTTAYVGVGNSVQIVSVANPGAMISVSTTGMGGTVWGMDLDATRNLLAVAASGAGLRLVDVSNLSTPVLRGTAVTGDARAVALRGDYAFVGDYTNSMTSVDITNLASPAIRSQTQQSLGGRLTGVALTGNFVVGSDVLFVNGVPIIDASNPAQLQPRTIINFPARDDNGMGIAADSSFLYLVTEHSALNRGGATGDSRLYIAQYEPNVDLAGVPPTVTITSPRTGNVYFEGAPLTVAVDAVDDIAVASVQFFVNGDLAFTSTSAPHQYTLRVPTGVSSLTLGARAYDLGNNGSSLAEASVSVVPDPLTRVTGRVLDAGGLPVQGAVVTSAAGISGTSDQTGVFSLIGVPTVLGDITVQAVFTPNGGSQRTGSSAAIAAVPGGVTDVGDIRLLEAQFETQWGTFWTNADDTAIARTLPFSFPFYGSNVSTVYVGTNGYITLNGGDSTYTETVAAFSNQRRISAFFDDLYGARGPAGAGVYINDTLPDRFIVTHDRVAHFSAGGANTLQIQLFKDGRIVFAFKGITALSTGSITGLTPGPNAPFQQVDFSATPSIDVAPGNAVYEYFTSTNLFDLDNSLVVFTPTSGGGYRVQTVRPGAVAGLSIVSGQATANAAPVAAVSGTSARAAGARISAAATAAATPLPIDIGNAEVRVRSSRATGYVAMTNTDASGNFNLSGIPAGGIEVEVWRQGRLLARGAGIIDSGRLTEGQLLRLELRSAETDPKSVDLSAR